MDLIRELKLQRMQQRADFLELARNRAKTRIFGNLFNEEELTYQDFEAFITFQIWSYIDNPRQCGIITNIKE